MIEAPARPDASLTEGVPEPAGAARALAAAALSGAAAAWIAGGAFDGYAARAVGLAGVAIGVGLVAASQRLRRPAAVQYLALPAAMVAGALLVLADTRGGRLVSLIADAIREGGLAQPPVPFEPGWRFIVMVVAVLLGAAGASLALALGRARVAVAVPVPVVVAGALVQPPGREVTSGAVAVALILAALAVSTETGVREAAFESRRLARGVGALVVLVVAVLALGRARVLFPEQTRARVVPPQRPPAGAALPDQVLFRVEADAPGPWRIGVLDGYDGEGWLLPSFDPDRLVAAPRGETGLDVEVARFTIDGLPGRNLPGPATPLDVVTDRALEIDPETEVLRIADAGARRGLTYTVTGPRAPNGRELAGSPEPPPVFDRFTAAPEPPDAVLTVLAEAPENAWDRVVFLRARLYANVVAAGAGQPAVVPPARVVEMLEGDEATPYEITAAEALLARWAGVPARIGFGFFGGDEGEGVLEVRPVHARTWLETYFEGLGWVPIVGTPPRARASLSPAEQRADLNVLPSEELAVIVHVPIRLRTVQLLYVHVRWWLARLVPIAAGIGLAWWAIPGIAKAVRARRRARWAAGRARERILVAYAGLRDAAHDLGVGTPVLTPTEFGDAVEPDEEHDQLAWLVTRALWGDLGRDLRDEDAERAEAMARSVTARLRRAHAPLARALAWGSSASLREPYEEALPRARAVRPFAFAPALLIVPLVIGAVRAPTVTGPGALPDPMVPRAIADLTLERERDAEGAYGLAGPASLVDDGRVFTIRDDAGVEGYVQVAAFAEGVDARRPRVAEAIVRSIAGGNFRVSRLGDERVWTQTLPEVRMFLWFAPDGGSMTLVVVRGDSPIDEELARGVLEHQRGASAPGPDLAPAYDPRLGLPR